MTEAIIPKAPTAESRGNNSYQPHELNPDLASAHMAELMMTKMPSPAIVSKEFVIWQGIFKGLQHTPQNKTYYDCMALTTILDCVSYNSVNIQGALFEKAWQYLMKPKVIIQGMAGQGTFEEEPKESLWDKGMRLLGRGGDKNESKPQ